MIKPEPRSFRIIAFTDVMTLTGFIKNETYIVWFLDTVYAQGSRNHMIEIYNRFVIPQKQLTVDL